MIVTLFGFMGVGKSVVGRMLAERLKLRFVDLDEEIEQRTGKRIADIFREEGEDEFRSLEREITKEVSSIDGQVITCGGGTVLDPDNVHFLRSNGVMILLTADPESIVERLGDDLSRPLLRTSNRFDEVKYLLAERWGRYLENADIIVDTTNRTPEQVVADILKAI